MGEYNGAYIFDVKVKKKFGKKILNESKSEKIDLTFKEENKISEERNGFRGIRYLAECVETGRIGRTELDEIDNSKLATVVKNLGYLYGSKNKKYTNSYVESIVRYVCLNYKDGSLSGYLATCYDGGMRARVGYNDKEERKSTFMVTQALDNEMMAQNALKKVEDRVTSIGMGQAIKTEGLNPEEKNQNLTK